MKIDQYFENINQIKIEKLKSGSSRTIEDLYHSLIKVNLPSAATIIAWDKILNTYINEPESIYFIRKYASAPDKKWCDIRRGFYTKYRNNFGYVYCDNFFAHYFYIMAMNNYIPEYEDFRTFILSKKIPFGFMETSEEKPYRAFKKGKIVGINKSGWKLAHIFSVNGNDYSFPYKIESKTIFPLGKQVDWKIQHNSDYPFRYFDSDISIEERSKMKAHFMRLVHPINYFLVPMQKYETDDVNNNIGEYDKLLKYMYLITQSKYQDIFNEYKKTILYKNKMVSQSIPEIGKTIINLQYGLTTVKPISVIPLLKNVTVDLCKSNKEYSEEIIAKVIYSYLFIGKSHRKIESEVLNLESAIRGGGFIAMKILHEYAIEGDKKGILKNKLLKNELCNAEGAYYQALVLVDKFYKTTDDDC